MKILLQWSVRMLRENPLHALFTVLNLVFNYTLLTSLKLFTRNRVVTENTDGDGIFLYLSTVLAVVVIGSTLLTMYNAFLVLIRERKNRYRLLSEYGTTPQQIRGSLFLEALFINVISLVLGVGAGVALFTVIMTAIRNHRGTETIDYLQRSFSLLFSFASKNQSAFGAFTFVQTTQRGLYFLIPEFCTVPLAMAMAAGKHMPGKPRPAVNTHAAKRAETQKIHLLVRRVFGVGGELNRLMDKRERSRRTMFLSAFVVSVVSLAIMLNATAVFGNTRTNPDLYLRSSGDNAAFEARLRETLDDPAFRSVAESVYVYDLYTPRVYCVVPDIFLSQTVKDASTKGRVSRRPLLYPVDGGRLITPQIILLPDDAFESMAADAGVQDADALLLPDRIARSRHIAYLRETDEAQTWTLRFYQNEKRFVILDAHTRNEKNSDDEAEKSGEAGKSAKIRPDYSCTDAEAYLRKAEPLTSKDDDLEIRVREITPEIVPRSGFWDENRSDPVLILPQRSGALIAPQLQGTFDGKRICVEPKADDPNGETLRSTICTALLTGSDGIIAEHPFGTGTRYNQGECRTIRDKSGDLSGNLDPLRQFFLQFFYRPPESIYADLYPCGKRIDDSIFLFGVVFFALMVFTMFTNIINVVYAHHMLRRHEYAVMQSCGMTKRQKRATMLYEAVWYSARSTVYGFLGFLLLYPACSAALSYGLWYEHLRSVYAGAPAGWTTFPITNLTDALVKSVRGGVHLIVLFPLVGVTIFILFMLVNTVVRRRVHAGELILLLRKDG